MSVSCTALRSTILISFFFPLPIALNFAWTKRHCHACKTPRSMYPSIYNSFPVIRTTIAKKSQFLRTPAFIFCLPWGRPCGNHAKRCMNEKTIQCFPNPRSMYLPIFFNIFRVIRCLSQCVGPKIAIFTTFLFRLGTPLGQSR